jgi:Fic family protein
VEYRTRGKPTSQLRIQFQLEVLMEGIKMTKHPAKEQQDTNARMRKVTEQQELMERMIELIHERRKKEDRLIQLMSKAYATPQRKGD